MAKKELTLYLRAKNELQVGLAKAASTLKSFGSGVLSVGKWIAGAFVGAGTAIAGFAAKALGSYAELEKATTALKSSFAAYGEEVAANVKAVQSMASAIKEETGASETGLVARAAKLKMLGVETTQLQAALRGTVALTQAGMDEEGASRAIAQAMQGNFKALNQYIPALRNAKTESEKMAMVNEFLVRGYTAQKDQLNTLAGQWGMLKERVGDAWETIGKAIADDPAIRNAIAAISDALKSNMQAFSEWADAGGIINFKATVTGALEEMSYRFQMLGLTIKTAIQAGLDVTFITYFGRVIGSTLNATIEKFKLLGAWGAAVWQKLTNPTQKFSAPDASAFKSAMSSMFADLQRPQFEATTKNLAKFMELGEKHAAEQIKISQQQTAELEANNKRRLESERNTLKTSVGNNQAAALEIRKTISGINDELDEVGEDREASERATLDRIRALNAAAADDVATTWADTAGMIAAAQEQAAAKSAAELASRSSLTAPRIGDAYDLGWTGRTGSFTGPASAPSMAGLGRPGSDTMGLRVQSKILQVMENIRRDNQQLLRMG